VACPAPAIDSTEVVGLVSVPSPSSSSHWPPRGWPNELCSTPPAASSHWLNNLAVYCNRGYSTFDSTPRDNAAADAAGPVGLARVLRYFLRLGTIGFGGPIATVGYMRRDLVERHGWIDRQDFLDGVALGQTMPGPLAAQVAMWVGYLRRGSLGALAVAVAFIAPSFLIVVAVGALYSVYSGLPVVQALFYGIDALMRCHRYAAAPRGLNSCGGR
jgi:hypothetical protein